MFSKVKTSSLKQNTLKDILVKTTHQKVLSLFLAYPAQSFYGSEISKRVGISIGQTSTVLNDLFRAGILKKERKGKTELYSIVDSSVLRIYKVLNTIVSISPLIEKLKSISRLIILYGSCSKGINTDESDLDLFIISNNAEKVLNIISKYPHEEYYGFSEIRAIVKKPVDWAVLEEKGNVFYNELQKGILLYEKEIDESRL